MFLPSLLHTSPVTYTLFSSLFPNLGLTNYSPKFPLAEPGQNIPKRLLRHLFTNTCNFCLRFWSFSRSRIHIKAQTYLCFQVFLCCSLLEPPQLLELCKGSFYGSDSSFHVFIGSSFFSHHVPQVSETVNTSYNFSICFQCFLSVAVNS